MPVGLFQVFPPVLDTTVATLGALGPTKFPMVEFAIPFCPVKVPKDKPPCATSAVNVPSVALTDSTYTVVPFKKDT